MNRQQIIRRDLTVVTLLASAAVIAFYFADQPLACGIAVGVAVGVEVTRWRLWRAQRRRNRLTWTKANPPFVVFGRTSGIATKVTIAPAAREGGERQRRWWRIWQLPVAALFIVPAVIILAAPKAVAAEYLDLAGICAALDDRPVIDTLGTEQVELIYDGYTVERSSQIIVGAIYAVCPDHLPLLNSLSEDGA